MHPTTRPLPHEFYERDVCDVARALVGCVLRRHLEDGTVLSGRIVETEAYSESEPASHSYRGRTPRNAPMFGPAGHAYVYLIYGVHECFNTVCGPAGHAHAVLIRAVEPLEGIEAMWGNRTGGAVDPGAPGKRGGRGAGGAPGRRSAVRSVRDIASGPGKLCQALQITRQEVNGISLVSGPVTIVEGSPPAGILTGTRIGISMASDLRWRFAEAGSRFVSKPVKDLSPE